MTTPTAAAGYFCLSLFFPCPDPPTATVTVCPSIQQRGALYQNKLADELSAAGPAVQSMAAEWLDLRDQARACRRKKP
jgi:hypothetical protein